MKNFLTIYLAHIKKNTQCLTRLSDFSKCFEEKDEAFRKIFASFKQ